MMTEIYTYLRAVKNELTRQWPENRLINIVCHGHSVPAGYFKTPVVKPFSSYPHLLHRQIKKAYPYAVVNCMVTAIGGENAINGSKRFKEEVLSHRPDVLTIDYSLNDRFKSHIHVRNSWVEMIEASLEKGIKVILLTPNFDDTFFLKNETWDLTVSHAMQVRELASIYSVGIGDTFLLYEQYLNQGGKLQDLLSSSNHPNKKGHQMIAEELFKYFMVQ